MNKNKNLINKKIELFFLFSLILIGSFAFANNADAATYYISTSGNDTNNGTSASTPWAHHPWDLNATSVSLSTTLQPDDTVIMKKGDIWWDCQLKVHDAGTSGHNIVTTSSDTFGSGSLPTCSGSLNTTSYDSGWTNDGGNVYHRTVTNEPKIVVYNGNILLADAGVTPALNKYYWSANILYVNIGGDPNSTTAWKVGKRGTPGYIRSNYVTLKDLIFEVDNGTIVNMVYIESHTGIVLDGLIVRYGIKGAIQDDTGGISNEIKNCTLSNMKSNLDVPGIMLKILNPTNSSYHNNTIIGGQGGILVQTGSSGTNSIYSNIIHDQVVYNTSSYGINLNTGNGWNIYDNTIYNIGDYNSSSIYGIFIQTSLNNVYQNTIYNSRLHGIILDNASLNNIYKNTIYNCGKKTLDGLDWIYYGSGADGYAIRLIGTSENNNIYKNYSHENVVGITNYTTGGIGNNKYYYNLVINSLINGMGIGSDGNPTNPNIIYNNTIIHNTAAANNPAFRGHALFMQNSTVGGGKGIFANNNIYSMVAGIDTHALWVQADNVTTYLTYLKIDNNNIYTTINGAVIGNILAHPYTTGSAYKAGISTVSSKITGLDGIQANAEINGTNSDPLFISSSNFNLLPTSPVINIGANVSLTSDYLGNPIVGAPDIGAYEFQAPTIPTSLSQYKTDRITTITSGNFTNEDSIVLKFNMSSSGFNSSDLLTPQVEIQESDVPFTNTVTNSGDAVTYSGSDIEGVVTVTGLTSGKTYHWQARVSNPATTSDWVSMGGSPDFQVDTTAPLTPIASPSAGTYYSTQNINLTANGSDSIRYSTESIPADCSTGILYTSPIEVSTTKTIYVRACDLLNNSSTASFVYAIHRQSSSGSSALSRYNNLISMGNLQTAENLKKQFPNQFTTQIISPSLSTSLIINKNLKLTVSKIVNINRILKLSIPRMIGNDVKTLQTYLIEKGYDVGTPDGIFGKKTKSAIILFQKVNGLNPDGLVGVKTREIMK